jgi:sarcosine oxidase
VCSSDLGRYSAARALVTAGAWLPGLVGGRFAAKLRVMRQVLYWFEPTEPALYGPPSCPVFIWMHGSGDADYMYGFPMVDAHGGVKVATEQYQATTDPDRVDRQVAEDEQRTMFERHVAGRLRSVTPRCVHAATCLYTVSPDSGFVVDSHPEFEQVTVVSACSGHGFKHSAAMGERLAQQALGRETGALSAFSLARLG